MVICMGEVGPLNLLPRFGKQGAQMIVTGASHGNGPTTPGPTTTAPRMCVTSWPPTSLARTRSTAKMKKDRTTFLECCRHTKSRTR